MALYKGLKKLRKTRIKNWASPEEVGQIPGD
jgi:hypothetical protein